MRGGRTTAILLAAAAAFVAVAGAAGTATYLVTTSRGGGEAPGAVEARPVPPPSASPSPSAAQLTAAELYHTNRWPYDITFDNGNRIQGELALIETYDHPDCVDAGLTELARLALADCTHRVEAAYGGTVEGSVVSEQVLAFTNANAAAAFLGRFEEVYAADVVEFQDPTEIHETAPWTGGWNYLVDRYMVLGVVFGPESDQQSADDLAARNDETLEYLRTRGS